MVSPLLVTVPSGEMVVALLLLPAPVGVTCELELLELLAAAIFGAAPELSVGWLRSSSSFFLSRWVEN